MRDVLDPLVDAILARTRVRLVYRRQADEITSIHDVAPVDIRPGWTERIRNESYLWAWCFAEDKAEMHLLERIAKVIPLDEPFDTREILSEWKKSAWPLPDEWIVPREWD